MGAVKLGYFQENIDPKNFPIQTNTGEFGKYVKHSIYSSVLSCSDGEKRALVICIEVRCIDPVFTQQIMPPLVEATGVPEENIVIYCTHNHSSPDSGSTEGQGVQEWIETVAVPATVKAAVSAIADEQEITGMFAGSAPTKYLTFVRRYLLENGQWSGIATGKPPVPRVAHETQADEELRAIRITRKAGKDIVLVNFQTHAAGACTQEPGAVTGDFVSALRTRLVGYTDANVMYVQGYCGNTNYNTLLDAEKPFKKQHFWEVGEALADASAEALKNAKEISLGKLGFIHKTITGYINHTQSHLYPKIYEIDEYSDTHGCTADDRDRMFQEIGLLNRYEGYALYFRSEKGKTAELDIATLAIGDFAMAFCPMEMFDVMGMQLRAASPYAMTFSGGYAIHHRGYMPHFEAFPHGVYETYVCDYLPGTGEKIVLESLAMLQEMKKA